MNKYIPILIGLLLVGATSTIVPTADVTNEWDSGTYADIDEGIASANDSDFITTDTSGNTLRFTLGNPGLTDGDTITDVNMIIRCKDNDSSNRFTCHIYIGGSSQGSVTINSNAAITNRTASLAGWDTDWTAAQLDGMEAVVVSDDTGSEGDYWLYTLDVEITYTAGAGGATNTVRMIL